MVLTGKFKLLKHGALLALALLFLAANTATHKHVVPTGLAKLITLDHEVRRDLARAEREGLKTSVASGRGELIPYPLQQAAGITGSRDIVLNSYRVPQPLTQLESENISLDFSPILNL
jgi:hypothetical protein